MLIIISDNFLQLLKDTVKLFWLIDCFFLFHLNLFYFCIQLNDFLVLYVRRMILQLFYQFFLFSLKFSILFLNFPQSFKLFVDELVVVKILFVSILKFGNNFFSAVYSHRFLYHFKLFIVWLYFFLQHRWIISCFPFLWGNSLHMVF